MQLHIFLSTFFCTEQIQMLFLVFMVFRPHWYELIQLISVIFNKKKKHFFVNRVWNSKTEEDCDAGVKHCKCFYLKADLQEMRECEHITFTRCCFQERRTDSCYFTSLEEEDGRFQNQDQYLDSLGRILRYSRYTSWRVTGRTGDRTNSCLHGLK